jgi:ATP-binding cassette subfamily C protein CydCD
MSTLLRLLRGFRTRIGVAAASASATVAAGVGLLATAAYLIVRADLQPPILDLTVAIVGVRFFGISRAVFRYGERLAGHDASLHLVASLRIRSFRALERIAPVGVERARSGRLLAGIAEDLEEIEQALIRSVIPILVTAVISLGAGLTAWIVAPPTAGVVLFGLGITALVAGGLTVASGRAGGRALAPARATLSAAVVDVAEGREEAIVFGRTAELQSRAEDADRALTALARRVALLTGGGSAAVALGSGLTLWLVVQVAVDAASSGRIDPVLLGAIALLAVAAFEPVTLLPPGLTRLEGGIDAARRMRTLEQAPDPVPVPPHPEPGPLRAVLELRAAGVRRAPGGRWDLHGIDLRLAPGRRVALVGASGSGKSTLIEVLLRFREIDAGAFLIDGIPASSLDPDDVRALIGVAGEEAVAVDDSLAANLRFGRPDADDDSLREVLDSVGLMDLLARLPDGLTTRIGPRGAFVSGGERRRIALARALLAGRPLLVVDEPTAGLDAAGAARAVAALLRASEGKGLLLVTHSTAGLEQMDEIVVLGGGRVVERGRYDRLVAAGGAFTRLLASS